MTPRRWRAFAHALDRTGPPVLLATFATWLREAHPGDELEVVAFRGGPVEEVLRAAGASVRVVLEPEEPWEFPVAAYPSATPQRQAELRAGLADVGPVDANLLVSVAASHALPLVPQELGPIATWAVEVGEDLRWLDVVGELRARTDRWLAGSEATRGELVDRLGGVPVTLVPEFVADHRPAPSDAVAAARAALGGRDGDLVVLAAGIGTRRKGIDLFVELAAAARRRGLDQLAFAWVGGQRDDLYPLAVAEAERLGLERLRFLPAVEDLGPWLEAADVLCHPARREAFPLVALHAVAAGTPVVAFSGVGGMGELLGPGFVGAPYPDVSGLLDGVAALADGERRADALAAQRGWVVPRFLVAQAGEALRRELDDLATAAAGVAP